MSDEYELERTATRETAAAVLRDIADGVAAGSVRLGEEDALAVEIPDAFELEVEFETGDDERSLEVELEWDEPTAVESFDGDAADTAEEEDRAESDAERTEESEESKPDGSEGNDAESTSEGESADSTADTAGSVESPVGAAEPIESLARFEVFADEAGEWRWRLVHRNGNVIATSGEGYTRKHNAQKGIRSVMQNASGAETVED